MLENLYTHHDVRGHEIIFVFETAFANPETYRREQFDIKDDGAELTARWFDSARFREGREQLFLRASAHFSETSGDGLPSGRALL